MLATNLSASGLFELVVMAFQMVGVAGLCFTRLMPSCRWRRRGRIAFIVALLGLGVSGALCGHHDSEFGLFAGGTMTVLLIGMTIGGGATGARRNVARRIAAEVTMAG